MDLDFAPLRVHTEYKWGGSSIEDYINLVSIWNYRGIGVVDPVFYGIHHLFLTADRMGIKPVIGAEHDNFIVFVKDKMGFQNYSRLLSGMDAGFEGLCVVVFDKGRYRELKKEGVDVYFGMERWDSFLPSGVKPVAVPPIYYALPEDVFLYSMLYAVREGRLFKLIGERLNLPCPYEVSRYPEMALKNTVEILEKAEFNPFKGDFYLPDGNLLSILPHTPLTDEEKERLDKEVKIIREKGLDGYFVLVKRIVDYARSRGIMVNVRGSGAGSLLLHLIGASAINPVRYKIPFERFLSSERNDLPDIDIDVDYRGRDEIVEFIEREYRYVSSISNVNRFEIRGAIRAVSRAMGVPHRMAGEYKREDILRWAERIVGKPSHYSTHASGIVISPISIVNIVPITDGNKGVTIQGDKDCVEALGLLKLDLLSVRGLGSIPLERDKHLPEDRDVFRLIGEGKTMGAFQIESPAMRDLLMELKPQSIEELGIALALVRPGAKNGGYREVYIRRRRGEEELDYFHPSLEPVLRESLGVFIYQEQVIEALKAYAGLSMGEADRLRRLLTKERGKDISKIRERFFTAAEKLGRENIEEVWERIRNFVQYGFNKGHSMSYAYLAYASMYSKVHHPLLFFKEVINGRGGYYPVYAYVEEARRWGINVLPPHIDKSEWGFSIENGALRTGFSFIKYVRKKTISRIVMFRPFKSFQDFLYRISLDTKEAEALIKAGCFDHYGISREELFSLLYTGERFDGRRGDYRLQEMEVLSFTRVHPVSFFDRDMCISEISEGEVSIIGRVIAHRRIWTKNGKNMGFFTIDDDTGYVECVLFPDIFRKVDIKTGMIVRVEGYFDGKSVIVKELSMKNAE